MAFSIGRYSITAMVGSSAAAGYGPGSIHQASRISHGGIAPFALGLSRRTARPFSAVPLRPGPQNVVGARAEFVLEQITNMTLVAAMTDFPRSLIEFQQRFGDEAACAQYLAAARWPDGFVCPGCGGGKAWRLKTKAWTYECAHCGRQTSVTAGTIMHHSKLPLTTWFWAAYVMATQPNGISALQLQRELSLGSYKTAWLLCTKLRRAMAAPGRNPLSGTVELDKTEITWRSKNDHAASGGASDDRKTLIVGAVEIQDLRLDRIRLSTMPDDSAASLNAFVDSNLAPDAIAQTGGLVASSGGPGINHDPPVV